jgi:BA14K-like protein
MAGTKLTAMVLAPSRAWYRAGEGGAMRLAVYGAVLAIALGSVFFGLDWLSAPMSPMVDTRAGLSAVPPPITPRANANVSTNPPAPAVPTNVAKPIAPSAPAQPKANIGAPIVAPGLSPSQSPGTQSASQSPAPNQNSGPVPVSSAAAAQATADTPAAPAEPQARCNVSACTAAYRSFTPADCTYQPSNGPRRLCTK